MDNYVVYCCFTEKEVLYVGNGKIGREKHCESGTSHVYKLNEHYFMYKHSFGEEKCQKMHTKIVKYFKTKAQAVEFEKNLIKDILPKYNKSVAMAEKRVSEQFGWLDNAHKNKKSLDMLLNLIENTHSN